jgi:hypothetical protein
MASVSVTREVKALLHALFILRAQGPTPTENTGPNFDHSTGLASGHYLLFEADQGPTAESFFRSPDLQSPTGNCSIRFSYYLYGAEVGTLTVQSRGVVNGEVTWNGVSSSAGKDYLTIALLHSYKHSVVRGASSGGGAVPKFTLITRTEFSSLS